MRITGLSVLFLLLISACGEPSFGPKPRAYPKVEYPAKAYTEFRLDACNFSFEYPAYAIIQRDSSYFESEPPHPCWFNVYLPDFDGKIHFSYYVVNRPKSLETLQADAFEMVDWHNKKANYIEEQRIRLPNGTTGFFFNIEGPAASPFQFFLTDSTRHFLRGALYFNATVDNDSLAPVYDFVKKDILHLIETFEWKD